MSVKKQAFEQLYSEQDVDFNISAEKLTLPIKTNQSTDKFQPSKLSNLAKIYLEGNANHTKKRKVSQAIQAHEGQTKLQSYRQRSKNRFNPILSVQAHQLNILQKVEPESAQRIMNNEKQQILTKDKSSQQDKFPKKLPKTENNHTLNYNSPKKILVKNLDSMDTEKKITLMKQRAARKQRLERAKQILEGKISVIWIFVINKKISEQLKDRIYQVYKALFDDDIIVPYVKQAWQIQPFLNLPNTYFKIVTDLHNSQQTLKYKVNVKVVQYYIFNQFGEEGISRALEYKSWSKKVKGIYSQLERIIEKTEEQIQDTIMIYKYNNGLQATIKQNKFPSFLRLSGADKSQATLYRANLYGAIKISEADRSINYQYFIMLVRQKYGKVQKQQQNIADYTKIKHLKSISTLQQARKIVQFYVRQSFYYQIVNSMLRTLKTTQQFKPCILPFNQMYNSVKLFYKQYINQHSKVLSMQLYRGAKLKKRDFNALKPGIFIEMFGFMSTSKSLDAAKKFTDKDGYIFIINVKERKIQKKWQIYDHGFVDINKYKLAGKQFKGEEQVLFNALNIYKVSKIQQKGPYTFIHIEYGAIFDLLQKKKAQLTSDERDVLINYQYCTKLLEQIQDQGDVHLLSNQFDQAKEYYFDKLKANQKDAKTLYKLANVQKQSGQIDQAEKNGLQSLKILTQKLDLNDRQTCLKVFSIHSKNAQINIAKEDYLNADEDITKSLQMLDESDLFTKAKKIRQRGEIKFKKGQVKQSQKDFTTSEKLFNQIEKQSEKKKSQINRKYFFSFITLICSPSTKQQLQQQKKKQLAQVEDMENKISELKQQIQDELVKVNKSLKDVAIYAEDKQKYQYCVKKGRALLLNIQQRQTNDPAVKAKLKVMQATIQNYLQLAQSQKLLNDAIALVQSQNQFDPTVGQYATILAKLQKSQVQKFTNPSSGMKLEPDKKIIYNQQQQKGIFTRCKNNFQKAIKVLLYNNKDKASPQIFNLKNQLGQLELYQNNYQSCQSIVRDIKQAAQQSKVQHSEIAKTSLLLCKIAFSRGQLKNSFKILNQSDEELKKALIKSADNPKYIALYQKNDIYLEIVLVRSKIFTKQLHHDLSLKQLSLLEEKINKKMQGYQSHNLLANVYQENAEIYANMGNKKFFQYFQKAIQLRKTQMGQYNILNAVTYCNYSKYLMMVNEYKAAQNCLQKAIQIFSCLSNDHPINWVIHFANGTFFQIKNKYEEADKLLKQSFKMAAKKFDSSHITLKKVRLRIAKVLLKLGSIDQSFKQLQVLQEEVDESLKESQLKIEINEQTDDEKVTLQKIILKQFKVAIQKQQNNIRFSQIQIQKYKKKYENLRTTFRLDNQ